MRDRWVLDVTMADLEGPRAFCPLDNKGNVVVGLTFISDTPPGELVGVFHEGGDEAVEAWCDQHPEELEQVFSESAALRQSRPSEEAP